MYGWDTRERPKIDRIACPWLITRFFVGPLQIEKQQTKAIKLY
ncbi:chromate resistance protein ChrB domain-containing protein [Pseudomonas sp. Pseusp11]